MKAASALYRLLGDEARLRLLRVLARERLNVTELTGVLGLAQSGVSRHLGLLKDAGLVAEERDGGFSYYRLACPKSGEILPNRLYYSDIIFYKGTQIDTASGGQGTGVNGTTRSRDAKLSPYCAF